MTIASLIMVIISTAFTVASYFIPADSDTKMFTLENESISLLMQTLYILIAVLLIKRIRGNKVINEKEKNIASEIKVIGYIWRTYLIKYISLFLSVFVMAVTFKPIPSIQHTITAFIFQLLFTVPIIWLLFSRNKRKNIQWLLSLFRGY